MTKNQECNKYFQSYSTVHFRHCGEFLIFFDFQSSSIIFGYVQRCQYLVMCQWMIAQMVEGLLCTRLTRVQIPAPAPYEITL